MLIQQIAQIAAIAASAAVNMMNGARGGRDYITSALKIAGGTARTVQWEASFDGGATWVAIGTQRTVTGDFVELLPRCPLYRVNCTANTGGSTIDGWLAE